MIRIVGIDLSLNHSGFVELDGDGNLTWWQFVSDVLKHSTLHPERGVFMPHKKDKAKGNDREQVNADRLAWWQLQLNYFMKLRRPTHVGIEDYAIKAESNSAYQTGELGGVARLAAMDVGAKLRLHDPLSGKMFSAHAGNAESITVDMAVRERWPDTANWNGVPEIPRIDLSCAYVIARMVLVETKLRSGELQLKELEHEKEIAVFTRCTKANPISLLGRDWITV